MAGTVTCHVIRTKAVVFSVDVLSVLHAFSRECASEVSLDLGP
jgi:hypothetical protein